MIISAGGAAVIRHDPDGASEWRCLARRGMLYSECEAVEHVRLSPGARCALRAGVEESLFVVRGSARLCLGTDGVPRILGERVAVLVGTAAQGCVTAGEEGAELVVVRTLSPEQSGALPPRVPELTRGVSASR